MPPSDYLEAGVRRRPTRPTGIGALTNALSKERQTMAKVFLLTGLSGAGKTTLASALCDVLKERHPCVLIDGDEMRKGVCADLGFSPADRAENIRRCGEFAKLLAHQDIVVVMAVIAPYHQLRKNLRNIIGAQNLRVIHVDCPLDVCMQRDPKRNYRKAAKGEIANYTGVADMYETPDNPDLVIQTHLESPEESATKLAEFVRAQLADTA